MSACSQKDKDLMYNWKLKKNVTNRPDFCTDNNQFINDCGIGLTLIYLSLYMNAELITYLH